MIGFQNARQPMLWRVDAVLSVEPLLAEDAR
jgi:hypothetical protein